MSAVSFAGNGLNSRSSHIFIADMPNGASLGKAHHERPFGQIVDKEEQQFLDKCNNEYGDITHLQGSLVQKGNAAAAEYPNLSRFKTCYVMSADSEL
jgi:hypothetical protein